MKDESGVYEIVNITGFQKYIGSTENFRKRWIQHACRLRKGKHHNASLQEAFNLCGESAFRFVVIEYCKPSELITREQFHIDRLWDSGCLYNRFRQAYSVRGECHPMYGRNHTQEAREKIREARSRQKVSHSTETRAKIGAAHRGRKLSRESIEKMIRTKSERNKPAWNKGLTASTCKSVAIGIAKITTQFDAASVINDYASGMSINAVALKHRCQWTAIKRFLVRCSITTRTISQQKKIRDGVIA